MIHSIFKLFNDCLENNSIYSGLPKLTITWASIASLCSFPLLRTFCILLHSFTFHSLLDLISPGDMAFRVESMNGNSFSVQCREKPVNFFPSSHNNRWHGRSFKAMKMQGSSISSRKTSSLSFFPKKLFIPKVMCRERKSQMGPKVKPGNLKVEWAAVYSVWASSLMMSPLWVPSAGCEPSATAHYVQAVPGF